MKHYLYTKTEAKNGKSYNLTVFEVVKKGIVQLVGTSHIITYGCQYGEDSEAYQVIIKKRPAIIKYLKRKGIKTPDTSYYTAEAKEAGLLLQSL